MGGRPRGGRGEGRLLVERVGELAGAARSLHHVLDGIVQAMAADGYPGAGITLINERDELYLVAYDGPPDDDIIALRLPVGQGIMGSVAATGRPLLVRDLDKPDGPAPRNRGVGGHGRMRSLLAVPIFVGRTVIGVLEVDSREKDRFDETDLDVFERIAEAIAGAVQEAGPLKLAGELLRRRVHEVMILEDATRALAASLDLESVFAAVVRSAATGLRSPQVALVELDGGRARVLSQHAEVGTPGGSGRLPSLDGLDGGAAPIPLDEVAGGLAFAVDALELRAVMAAGISAGTFAGALLVSTSDERGFDPAEARLLEGIADLAGLAINNARSYRRLEESASIDATTGLYNRGRFERELARVRDDGYAVISIDVDRLKGTNDAYGHEAGDAVLCGVAATLRSLLPGTGLAARTGGDEFAIVLEGADQADATAVAEELRQAMHGVSVPFGVARISAGVAAGLPRTDPRVTWSAADAALDRAKRHGRNRVEVSDTATARGTHAGGWESVIEDLLRGHALSSVYQPVVRLGDLEVIALEALARPAGAAADVSVEGLFAAAHRSGRSRDLDWLARQAALDGARGIAPGTPLFVNVGIGALLDPLHDVDQMLLLLEWGGRSPADVVLEITEREVVDDLGRFTQVLRDYRAEGFRFAVDDVGEGHSTLEVLAAAEPEFVKIARSLTISSDQLGARSAIRAVVAFARSSGAGIIAEGIEHEHEATVMDAFGVDHGQGWFLGRPAPAPVHTRALHVVGHPQLHGSPANAL